MTTKSKKWAGRSAIVVAVIALFFGARGCMTGPTANKVVASTDPRPDPKQPFPNMNGAGMFLDRGNHERPQVQIPPRADQATVTRIISDYVRQLITDETRQLAGNINIEQAITGAIAASVNAYNAAVNGGAMPTVANQSAMLAAAQYLCGQGLTGPLICPLSLGFDTTGITVPRVQ